MPEWRDFALITAAIFAAVGAATGSPMVVLAAAIWFFLALRDKDED